MHLVFGDKITSVGKLMKSFLSHMAYSISFFYVHFPNLQNCLMGNYLLLIKLLPVLKLIGLKKII